jgi:hypothetical protein
MSKIKGQNFRLLMSGSAVPEETNVSITLTGNAEDTSTKDTEGLFTQETIVSTAWSAQVDSYQAEPAQLRAILTTFIAATAVAVGWDETTGASGTQNRTPANANFKRSGQALLNDFTMQFDDRATVTTSLQFQGTGALS